MSTDFEGHAFAYENLKTSCTSLGCNHYAGKGKKSNFEGRFQAQALRDRSAKQDWIVFKQGSVAWTWCMIGVRSGCGGALPKMARQFEISSELVACSTFCSKVLSLLYE